MGPEAALAQTAVVQERFGALIGRNASAAHRWGRAKTQFEREIAKSTAVATILNREAVVADRTAQMASRIEAKRRIIASIEEMTAAGRLLENEAELQRLYLSWATLGSVGADTAALSKQFGTARRAATATLSAAKGKQSRTAWWRKAEARMAARWKKLKAPVVAVGPAPKQSPPPRKPKRQRWWWPFG